MSTRSWNKNRGIPWLYAAIAVGGIVAILAIGIIWTSFVRPVGYPGQPFYPWFPFGSFWIWPLFGLFFIFFAAKWFLWGGWGWRSGYWYYGEAAGSILSERYARGEITKEQFEQMRKDLEQAQ
ncbi:MAG: SHOCT domain-containing protein [Thaumarchaeota archaeon]|nr:SHOCT domain-containing protein [Nitrososphaerota archaeon]